MADRITAAQRSALMAKIRSSGTKPELRLGTALRRATVREPRTTLLFRNARHLPGKPDFVLAGPAAGLAVFVHGCFWHCCPAHWRLPKTHGAREGWAEKFARNRRRDVRVRRQLRALGYGTAVVWEHDLRDHRAADHAAARIVRRLLKGTKTT